MAVSTTLTMIGHGDLMKDRAEKKQTDRSLFDQKCVTCGTWMVSTENKVNEVTTITYSCPECGLTYTVDK
ncbi:hypothetical protein [Methanococcoides sp. LMO-2]|uniref:Uncharacterized protein n=1 Tax=Methanococcoides cohabitans TaxID=3136559 RepID=A0ABU9KVB6_9EURY